MKLSSGDFLNQMSGVFSQLQLGPRDMELTVGWMVGSKGRMIDYAVMYKIGIGQLYVLP